jgi:hypothetical protein
MGEAHFDGVGDELVAEFLPAQRDVAIGTGPGAGMDLVDGDRLGRVVERAVPARRGGNGGDVGRQIESTEDSQKIDALAASGRLKKIEFQDRQALLDKVAPVMAAYAKEIEADAIMSRISAVTS